MSEFLQAHPVRYRLADPERRTASSRPMMDDPSAADMLEKLESLGYVGSGGADGGESITARNNAGVALMAEGRFAEAEQEFRAGLEEAPGAPMLTVNLALARRLQGDREARRGCSSRPSSRRPRCASRGTCWRRYGSNGTTSTGPRSWSGESSTPSPTLPSCATHYGLILEARDDARGRRARSTSAPPRSTPTRRCRVTTWATWPSDGKATSARPSSGTRSAIEADPYFMGAYNNLALVYQAQGRMDDAIDLYGRSLGKAPENAVVLNNLGSLYYATGKHEQAHRMWIRSANADPGYASPLNNIAGIEINAQRLAEAERLLVRALDLDPDYGDARINLSIVFHARGQLDAARNELQRATEDPRTGSNSWTQLGLFELEQGRSLEAVTALERARELEPGTIRVLNALGEAYYRGGEVNRAREVWSRSLELQPDQPRLRRFLAGE